MHQQRRLTPLILIQAATTYLPPVRDEEDTPVVDLAKHKLVCHTELGGHPKPYRAAA